MIREGMHTLYVIEAKRTEVADGSAGPYLSDSGGDWFDTSHDAFCFPDRWQSFQAVGENNGWTELESARKALAWARNQDHFQVFDGYGRVSSRVRYAFRIRESILIRKDRVLED